MYGLVAKSPVSNRCIFIGDFGMVRVQAGYNISIRIEGKAFV